MNASCHCRGCNKKRGQLMAVSESAVGVVKGSGESVPQKSRTTPKRGDSGLSCLNLSRLQLNLALALGLAFLVVSKASAQIVAYKNAPGSQQPTILNAGNGVPLVNIQTPSAAGVSRNTYSQFDVQSKGAILNNSRTDVQTQLGGWVQGNPWLATGNAKIILNEVFSTAPSMLGGTLEIAGQRAQLIIANPAGITCSGCGFLNASRATLTTGEALMNDGALTGYRVRGGTVKIEGAGLEARATDHTELIARAVEINAGLWAKEIKLLTGNNQVNAEGDVTGSTAGTGTRPVFGIDVAQLGGMYANKIILVGTEAGVGVRTDGRLISSGDVFLTAEGKLTHRGQILGQGIHLQTRALENQGIINGEATRIETANLQNQASGNLYGTTLDIRADALENRGEILGERLDLAVTKKLGNAGRIGGDEIQIVAETLDNSGGTLESTRLGLNARAFLNVSGKLYHTGEESLRLNLETLDNREGRIESQRLEIQAVQLTNTRGVLVAGHLVIDSDRLTGDGQILSVGDLELRIRKDLGNTGQILANGSMLLVVDGKFENRAMLISGEQLSVKASAIDNTVSGKIQAGQIYADSQTFSNKGQILGNGMGIQARVLDNRGEMLGDILAFAVTDTLENRGLIDGVKTRLEAARLENPGGRIYGDHLALVAGTLINTQEGTIAARDRLDMGVGTLENRDKALILSVGDMAIGGALDAAGHATGQAKTITNESATIEALGNLSMDTASLVNRKRVLEIGRVVAKTELPTGKDLLDYAPELQFHWTIERSSATIWRDFICNRYINLIAKLLGGGPTEELVAFYNPTPDPDVDPDSGDIRRSLTLGRGNNFSNVWGNLAGYTGPVGGGLDDSTRAQLVAAVNAKPLYSMADSHTIWTVLIDALEAQNPKAIDQMARAVAASLAGQTRIKAYRQVCEAMDNCSDVSDKVTTLNGSLHEVVTKDSPTAVIRAGRNATLNATSISNQYSMIQSGGDMRLTGSKLNNVGAELYQITDTTTTSTYWHWGDRDHGTTVSASSTQMLIGNVPAIISAGGTLTGSFSQRIDNLTIRQNSAPVVDKKNSAPPAKVGLDSQNPGISSIDTAIQLPASRLYVSHPESTASCLVETDPRFTNYRQWLSSEYLLSAFTLDPSMTQKRLGDGFYEQRLITEQVAQLTGRRFLEGYADDEAQYRALMNAGISVAQEWNLIPGIALSAEQIAQLTTDIVWLVEREVRLADGTTQKVLVPQLYATVREGDLSSSGALLAGNDVVLETDGNLTTSGTIAGRQVVVLSAENINVLRGNVTGESILAQAGMDIRVKGGTLVASEALIATAGRDITVESSMASRHYDPSTSQFSGQIDKNVLDRVAGLYVTGENGTMVLAAEKDIKLLSAALVNMGQTTVVSAGHDLTLGTLTETSQSETSSKGNSWKEGTATDIGSQLFTQGDLTLVAGNDFNARAANVVTGENLAVQAGHNLTITTGEAHYQSERTHEGSSGNFLSGSHRFSYDSVDQTTALSSTFSGNNLSLSAGNNIRIRGSDVVAQHALTAQAGQDIVIDTAQNTQKEIHARKETESGFGFSWGSVAWDTYSSAQTSQGESITQTTSTLAGENVHLVAGRDVVIVAGNIVADKDISVLAGRNIDILVAEEKQHVENRSKQSSAHIGLQPDIFGKNTLLDISSGNMKSTETLVTPRTAFLSANGGDLTLMAGLDSQYKGTGQGNISAEGADLLAQNAIVLSGNAVDLRVAEGQFDTYQHSQSRSFTAGSRLVGPVGSLIDNLGTMIQARKSTDNQRLKNAYALKAGYDAWKLYDTASTAVDTGSSSDGGGGGGSGIGVQFSVGMGESESEFEAHGKSVIGTNLQGKRIEITARETDIHVQSGKLQAEDITLDAQRDILLEAAANYSKIRGNSESSTMGSGVTFGGGAQNGISFQFSMGGSDGWVEGEETTWDNTLLTATNQLTLRSGNDTTLKGAQLAAEKVTMNVGGNLLLETLQDETYYDSQSSSSGFNLSLCIPPICVGSVVTFGVTLAQEDIHHAYRSAVGQTGIFAGDKGFEITVKGGTELVGAAITSTQAAIDEDKNSLATARLSYSDLVNTQETYTNQTNLSVTVSTGASALANLASNATANLLGKLNGGVGLPEDKSESSQTLSVISPGRITITGTEDPEIDAQSQEAAETLSARDPKSAHQGLDNGLSLQDAQELEKERQKAHEKQQAAQLVGAVLSGIVNDLGLKEGSVEKIALHSMVGLLEAKLGDGNITETVIQREVLKTALLFADEAYRVSFLVEAKVYQVERDINGDAVLDADKNPVMRELTEAEKLAIKPGSNGKVNVYTNGIFNDKETAGKYALQMSELPEGESVYLVYYPQAGNAVSELMVSAYQKTLEGNLGDLSNAAQEIKNFMNKYGEEGLNLVGHSRGAMTIGNAMESLKQDGATDALLNTTIQFFGPAYNVQNAANLLGFLSNNNVTSIQVQNHADDFVGSIIGGNLSTYSQRPAESSRPYEWFRILFSDTPTAHNCYGNASKVCTDNYGNPVTQKISR